MILCISMLSSCSLSSSTSEIKFSSLPRVITSGSILKEVRTRNSCCWFCPCKMATGIPPRIPLPTGILPGNEKSCRETEFPRRDCNGILARKNLGRDLGKNPGESFGSRRDLAKTSVIPPRQPVISARQLRSWQDAQIHN